MEFTPSGSMHRYGYDPYRANAGSLYEQLQINGETLNLAYKSVPQGGFDVVYIEPQGNGSLNGVTYAYQSGAALTANPAGNGTKSLFLPAPAGGSDNLLVLCSMDTTSREAAIAGALSVVSYPLTRHRVAVVPVGSAQPSFSVTELRTQLNAIYAPAVIEWEVTQLPAVTATYWDENNDTKLQIPATDYSPEMRGVWQSFLASSNPTPGTAYLFIVSAFDSAQYSGYMPIKSNYGFLTPSATPRSAAHELGHGLFNLWHTFSTKNIIKLQKESTQNLMDYSNGTELWKYQWDYTHNPEGGCFVFEDSEEGANVLPVNNGQKVKEVINAIRNRNITGVEVIDFILDFNYDLNFFGRDIELGGKTYNYIKIDSPLLNNEEGKKRISTNMFTKGVVLNEKIPFSSETVEVIALTFKKINNNLDRYEPAEFEIIVLKEDAEELEEYILSEKKVPISQIIPDEFFAVQTPGNCYQACVNIINRFDRNIVISDNLWALASYNRSDNIYIHQECYSLAIQALDNELENGRPVIVGVNYMGKGNVNNFDKGITDHWVIIVGRGQNADGLYYTYFEVAPSQFQGTSQEHNRFVLQSEGYLEAINKTVNSDWYKPIVTAIRIVPSSCACSRYNFVKPNVPDNCGDYYNHQFEPNGTLIKIR